MSVEESRQASCLQLYAPETESAGQMRLIVSRTRMWKVGQTVTVTFFDDPSQDSSNLLPKTPRYRHLVEHYARMWERWANIKFKFVDDDNALIRITSAKEGSNSAVGTDAKHPGFKGRGTMNLECADKAKPSSYSRSVSHEFGHAIGCEHEQQNPNRPFHYIPKNVIDWYLANTSWEEPTVQLAFNKFKPSLEIDGYESSKWDKDSIMHYHMEKDWTEEGIVIERSSVISPMDKKWIGQKYPFSDSPVSGAGADKLLDRTSYAATEAYEYKNGIMYLNVFCQSDSYSLYKLTYVFRKGSPKLLDPNWETERIQLPLHGEAAPAPGTPLAAIRHGMGDFKQIVQLFYLDRNDYIRECVFVNGELKSTNRLNTQVASYSRLSAIYWQGKDEAHIRLFYQSARDDHIQEYKGTSKWNGTTAVTSWDMGAYVDIGDEYPLSGSELSFVNLTWDTACIRGFYQNTAGQIKQCVFTNNKWSLMPDWSINDAPYATSFAAMVWDKGEPGRHKPILYHKGLEYPGSDDHYIYKSAPGPNAREPECFCSVKVPSNTRLGFIDSDCGYRLFSTAEGKLMQRVSPGKGKSFASPEELKFDWTSNLGHGGHDPWADAGNGDDGTDGNGDNSWDNDNKPNIIQPSKPGPAVGSGNKGPFGW